MKEVQFKHKHANHTLHIEGKHIKFIKGKASVTNDVADAIINLQDEDYTVQPEVALKKKGRRKKGA